MNIVKKIALLSAVAFSAFAIPATAQVCATGPNVVIPDDSINTGPSDANPGSPGVITIEVPAGVGGVIDNLDVQIDMAHTFISGTTVTLIDRPGRAATGGGGGFGCARNNIQVTLDDDAATDAEDQCAFPFPAIGGTQRPTGNLSDFDGETLSGTWTFTTVHFFPADQGTYIAANTCISGSTTPVTINTFETRKRGKSLVFDWQTASEAFNLGFHLWGKVDGDWQQLNRRLIGAQSFDSVTPRDYKRRVNLLRLGGELTEVGISALSTSGKEDFYGPFQIGEKYGEATVPRYIDWQAQRESYDQALKERGYTKVNNRLVKNRKWRAKRNERLRKRYPDVSMTIKQDGVYRISYEQLLAQGYKFNGMPIHKMAITRNGQAVARLVPQEPMRHLPDMLIALFIRYLLILKKYYERLDRTHQ